MSPDPSKSPAIGQSHKRDEASSVRNKTKRALEKVVCHSSETRMIQQNCVVRPLYYEKLSVKELFTKDSEVILLVKTFIKDRQQ